MITDYTTKDASTFVTLNVNRNNIQSQSNRQSTNINNDNTIEAGNKTEILRTRVTLLLKFPSINNDRNKMRNLLQ